jgi:NADPH:quinone reductase-like Zn-dependent oxidoreductase
MLVQGSSGGVATTLIQLGAAAGMRVWSTGRSAGKRGLALTLGAERTFGPGEEMPEFVDAVFDLAGKETWAHSLQCARPGGTVVCSGMDGGAVVEMELTRLFVEQIDGSGVYAGTREEFLDLIAFVCLKGIVPHVGQVLPVERAEEGLRRG